MTRRIVYYVAASADGFIARKDGSVDWLESRPAEDYGIGAFLESVDTIVWGRRTFEESLPRGGIEPFGPRTRHVVLTRDASRRWPGVETHAGDVASLARRLRAEPGKDVWIMGGGEVAGAFVDARCLDLLIVHVIPLLLGEGIPLFGSRARDVPMRLVAHHAYADGVLRLDYAF